MKLTKKDMRDLVAIVPNGGTNLLIETDEGEVITMGVAPGIQVFRNLIRYLPDNAEMTFENAYLMLRDGRRVQRTPMVEQLTTDANHEFKPTSMTKEMLVMRNELAKLSRKLTERDIQKDIDKGKLAEDKKAEILSDIEAKKEEEEEKKRQAALAADVIDDNQPGKK